MNRFLPFSFCLIAAFFTGCQYEEVEIAQDCSAPSIELIDITPTSCGLNVGSFTAEASGASDTYLYSLDGGAFLPSGEFEGLGAASYTLTVREEATGCTFDTVVNIQNAEGLNIQVATQNAGCDTDNGSVTVTAEGGVPPYQYSIDDGANFGSSSSFSSLGVGQYQVVVRDADGCQISQEVTLATGVSFADDVWPIIQTNCALSSCHGGPQSPNFSDYASVSERASRISARVTAETMPPPSRPDLTQAQIDAINCWVDEGAQDN